MAEVNSGIGLLRQHRERRIELQERRTRSQDGHRQKGLAGDPSNSIGTRHRSQFGGEPGVSDSMAALYPDDRLSYGVEKIAA